MTPSFIRLRERFIDMSSPQSYREWDEVQMGEELTAAAAFGSADSYAQRRLGYRMLMGRCGSNSNKGWVNDCPRGLACEPVSALSWV